ncbi:MAG: pentapeptide repeat-containing protein [Rhodobacteraceae bacterium]|nr:pentapeptide repeat-containing protein [Paracoccaceae bacterium]
MSMADETRRRMDAQMAYMRDQRDADSRAGEQIALAHIAELSRSAQTTWLLLLGVLLFCTITLMGVQDADFFVASADTDLPLVGVAIPTGSFFLGAPVMLIALYVYLHILLSKLWEAIGDAPSEIRGQPLRKAIFPWILSDAAMRWRGDASGPFSRIATLLGVAAAWIATPAVLGWFWLRAAPTHDAVLTLGLGVCFVAALAFGLRSWSTARRMLNQRETASPAGPLIVGGLTLAVVAGLSLARTGHLPSPAAEILDAASPSPTGWTASARLTGAELAQRPADWVDYDLARRDFEAAWARRLRDVKGPEAPIPQDWRLLAAEEFDLRRAAYIDSIPGRDFGGLVDLAAFEADPANYQPDLGADLRRADLSDSFLAGLRFVSANLSGADLTGARMERADFTGADLANALISRAGAERTSFAGADMTGVIGYRARLNGAHLRGADLSGARLWTANLTDASLHEASAADAAFRDADLSGASLAGADLSRARDLTQTQINAAFGDGATRLPAGLTRPGHWASGVLTAADRHAEAWRAWRRTPNRQAE